MPKGLSALSEPLIVTYIFQRAINLLSRVVARQPQEDSTMFKKMWKDEEAVSPVIATILMVAITVVLAGVLVVYMQQFSGGPGEQAPNGTFVATTFSNPSEGTTAQKTQNSGGWSVKVTAITGSKPGWSEVTVTLKSPAGVNVKSLAGVKQMTGVISYETTGINWYLVPQGTPQYNESNTVQAVGGNEASVSGIEFQTIENAWFVIMDNDGDKKLSPNDIVMVYKDNDSNGSEDITSGYSLEFKVSAGSIGGAPLN